jgi:hypothetical protein
MNWQLFLKACAPFGAFAGGTPAAPANHLRSWNVARWGLIASFRCKFRRNNLSFLFAREQSFICNKTGAVMEDNYGIRHSPVKPDVSRQRESGIFACNQPISKEQI